MSATPDKKQPLPPLEKLPDPPTQPGIYWFKGDAAFYEVMVEVREINGQLMQYSFNRNEPVASLKGEWSGPVKDFSGPQGRCAQSGQTRQIMEKRCANCSLPFECQAQSLECWCKTVKMWQPIRQQLAEKYDGCLCKTCLSLAFYTPNQLRTVWGLDGKGHL